VNVGAIDIGTNSTNLLVVDESGKTDSVAESTPMGDSTPRRSIARSTAYATTDICSIGTGRPRRG